MNCSSKSMNITVILCTYNRCQSLVKALGSVALLEMPESVAWEVLVVDNNSRDRTRDVVQDFSVRYPGRFRYLFEPQPGKSHALNRAIAEAQGDVLAFLDDDVRVEPMWLRNLTAALLKGKLAGCGGRILPEWNSAPPRWLPKGDYYRAPVPCEKARSCTPKQWPPDNKERYALGPLALFDLGLEAGRLTEPPFGTNMAFQKAMFAKYGGFRADLGPRPRSEIRCEDTEFGRRLLEGGEQLWYEPSAIVYHPVTQNRLRKQYFLAWWFDKARADVRAFGLSADVKLVLAGIPLRLFRGLAVWTVRWMLAVGPSRRFSNKLKVWSVAGRILECYCQAHSTQRQAQ